MKMADLLRESSHLTRILAYTGVLWLERDTCIHQCTLCILVLTEMLSSHVGAGGKHFIVKSEGRWANASLVNRPRRNDEGSISAHDGAQISA